MTRPPGRDILAKPRPTVFRAPFTLDPHYGPVDANAEAVGTEFETYKVIQLDAAQLFGGASPTDQVYEYQAQEMGDHLYVAEIAGVDTWYVQLGGKRNPRLRLREGTTYKRVFRELLFSVSASGPESYSGGSMDAKATVYVSIGPLVDHPSGNSYGARNPNIFNVTVTTTFTNIFGLVYANHHTVGKHGGFLMLRNYSLINTIFISYDQNGAVSKSVTGFPIEPGQTLTIPLDDPMARGIYEWGAVVPSGTAEMRVIVSGCERDLFDQDQNKPRSIST